MPISPDRTEMWHGLWPRAERMESMNWRIGTVTVTKVVELESTGGTRFILPQAAPDVIRDMDWLIPRYANEEGRLRMSIHSYVVEADGRRILVDTGLGNGKRGRHIPVWNDLDTPYLFKLSEAGFAPETIDTVICTHLHVDHVGWNTRLSGGEWVPTFSRARYLFGRTEYDYWSKPDVSEEQRAVFADSVKPVVEAGQSELIADEYRISESVSTFPTPGHSPGHLSLLIRSGGEQAALLGDVAHHPCQFEHPDWSSSFDFDPAGSARTRERVFRRFAGTRTRIFGGHFDPGYAVAAGSGFRLVQTPEK